MTHYVHEYHSTGAPPPGANQKFSFFVIFFTVPASVVAYCDAMPRNKAAQPIQMRNTMQTILALFGVISAGPQRQMSRWIASMNTMPINRIAENNGKQGARHDCRDPAPRRHAFQREEW